MISANHPNRKPYNFAIYDSIDKILLARQRDFQGVVYDFGCGEVPYREWISQLQGVTQYVGVDWANTLHSLKANIVADLNQPLPIGDEVANTVVSFSTLEHLSCPSVMLAEAFRVLKTGGRIIIQVPWQWQVHEAPYDFYRYSPFGLKHLLEKAGFLEIEVLPQAGFFTMWFLKLNYFMIRLIRGPAWLRVVLRFVFSIIWYLNQRLAAVLDRLDADWCRESPGFVVVAVK